MSAWIKKQRYALTLLTLAISNAYAVAPGFYMGLSTGPATNNGGTQQAQTTVHTTTPVTPQSRQWGTSVHMGYKANQYAGAEWGFMYFSGINYNNKNVQTCSGTAVRVRDLYAAGKFSAPIGKSGEVFAKAGAAIVYQSTSGSLNPQVSLECGKTTYTNSVKPMFAIGGSYDLSQNWVADLTYTQQTTSGPVSSVSMIGLGISYHFVDTYCGQFLC